MPNKFIRTDLAMESAAFNGSSSIASNAASTVATNRTTLRGLSMTNESFGSITETIVTVEDDEGARTIGRSIGRYVTLSCDDLPTPDVTVRDTIARRVSLALSVMVPKDSDVLVIGLGNRRVTADSLGPSVVDKLIVTRHMKEAIKDSPLGSFEGRLRTVSALTPGVLGVTGMETAEVVRGVVDKTKPGAIIAIDALAARETSRICSTIQIADSGIEPGSGIGGKRMALTRETLGVPVVALGVPMVVYASTIARDALSLLADVFGMSEDEQEQAFDTHVKRVLSEGMGDMVVTPREVDDRIDSLAMTIAYALNSSLQPELTSDEIELLSR